MNLIYKYTAEEAIADGMLVKVFDGDVTMPKGSKPILATATIISLYSVEQIKDIWNIFNKKRKHSNGINRIHQIEYREKIIWVVDDKTVYTILFPDEY